MTRFSIVVPVYNAEQHLGECLESVFAQTCQDFEIICVDDGSTDGSRRLLETRAFDEERMHIVERANGGPSAARNDGIRVAQGDFICFLDADDALEPTALERIGRAIDAHPCDAVVFGWSYHPAAEADRFVREHARVRDVYYERFEPGVLFCEMSNPYLRLAVRRDALAQSGVWFDETLRVGEDAQFLFALYPRIGAVSLVSDELYRYRLPHDGSIMADYKDDVARLSVCDLNAAIAIFADWKNGGMLCEYGSHLVKWFVKGQLYTILRQPVDVREPLTALVRQMWRANFSTSELLALDLDEQTARLVRIVLAASDKGRLVIDEKELSRALLAWRVSEYGATDLARTAFERTVSLLLRNRHMLLKSATEPAQSAQATGGAADERRYAHLDASQDAPDAWAAQGALDAKDAAMLADSERAPLVSVVVPVYNVENYLDQALDSICRQTLREIEVICVNDGSTDGSSDIMRKHAELDSRIHIIDKPNGGYGSACNAGIAVARGIWVAIVEPDDWIAPDMYASMVKFAASFDEPVDIVKTPYWRIWMPDTDQQRCINCSYRGRIKPPRQPFTLFDPGVVHLIIHHPSIWSALYRRDFLARCNITFREIPGAGWADNPFLAETMCQAQSIVYLDEPFYHYREETPEKTASTARNNWKVSLDRWQDMADVYERLGVTDENVRRAHVRRGFTYIGLILEYHDIESEDDVRESVEAVFARMDDELVFSESNISPGSKALYARVKGVPLPKCPTLPYAMQVLKGGAYNIVNTGPAMTLDTLKTFVAAHAKREGK